MSIQGGLGLPDRDYYLKNDDKLKEYREKYVGFVGNILGQAGDADASKSAREIFVLETRLARAHWTNVENRDAVKTYNKVAVADLAKQFPGFDWDAWTTELGVNSVPAVVVNQPSYLKALAATVNELPVDAWKPYLKASLLNGFAPYLNKPIVDAEFGFYNTTLRGVKEQQPRWKRGVNTLNGNLGEMLGKLYVERHFKPEAKARMEALVDNLREAYRRRHRQARMDGARDQEAGAGEAREVHAEDRLSEQVARLLEARDQEGRSRRQHDARLRRTRTTIQLGKAGKPIDPEQWGMTPQTINAYYNPVRNEIVFPAAILQPPFFNLEADDAVNYGGIGAVIGHEMGHGFDDQGRRFDATGALRDWWTQDRRSGISEARQGARRAVQRVRAAARPARQRRADARREHRRPDRPGDRAPGVSAVAQGQGRAGDRRHHRPTSASTWAGRSRGGRRSATSRCASRC